MEDANQNSTGRGNWKTCFSEDTHRDSGDKKLTDGVLIARDEGDVR